MGKQTAIQSSFNSGEISPRLFGRVDLENKYRNGCALLENFMLYPHGGATKRPGTVHVAEIADSTAKPYLYPFQYNTEESYILCFENNLIRVFANGGIVTEGAANITGITAANPAVVTIASHGCVNGEKIIINSVGGMTELNNREFTIANATTNTFELSGVDSSSYTAYTSGGTANKIVEITTTYTTAQLPDLRFAQSADTLYIAHETHPLAKLTRSSNTVWTLTDIDVTDGPFREINGDLTQKFFIAIDSTITNVTGATQADPVVITAASHGYKSGECVTFSSVGGMTQLNGNRYFIIKLTDDTFSLRDESYRDIDGTAYGAYTSGGTVNRSVTKWGTYSEGATNFTLTTDFAYFHADMVGQLIRLYEPGSSTGITTPVSGATISNSSVITHDSKIYGLNNLSGTTTWVNQWTQPTHARGVVRLSNGDASDTVDTVFLHDIKAVVKITGYTNATSATCEIVHNHVPADTITYGTSAWEEGAWSAFHGYPRALAFHEQRLWLGGTTRDPQTVWASFTNAFESFADGDEDNDAITFQIASTKVDVIRWISAGKSIAIGTVGSEYSVAADESGAGITASNVRVTRQRNYGSSRYEPVQVNNVVVMPARFGDPANDAQKLREFKYDFADDEFQAGALTIISEHIAGTGLQQLTYAEEPNSTIWSVRADGQLVGCVYERQQDVVGFSRHILGGSFSSGDAVVESVAVTPGTYGDELWLVVKRTIDGSTVRYVEYISREKQTSDGVEDLIFMDSSATYDGSATTTISGLYHLRGETVGVIGDGDRQNDVTVSSTGSITIDSASKVHVGLKYTSKLQTLEIEAGAQRGTAQSRIQRVPKVYLRTLDSLGGKIGTNSTDAKDITYRDDLQTAPQTSPALYSGLIEAEIDAGYERSIQIYMEHDDPYPMTLTALVEEVNTAG
jgi:hypothetical protein